MNRTLRTASTAGAMLALAACAPMDEAGTQGYDATLANVDTTRACFFEREVNGYANAPEGPGGRDRLYISTGIDERWLLETWGPCPELDFSLAVQLDVRGAGNICTGESHTLVVPSSIGGGAERCEVRVLGRVMEPG